MKNSIGFYILSRAWDYLLSLPDYSRGDGDAMRIISDAKTVTIYDDATDQDEIKFLIECNRWHSTMMPDDVEAEVL
jgi:hypothetical protein